MDVVTVGKNAQICATLFNDDHKPKPGLLSQTFTGATTQIKAAHYVISEIVNGGYLGENGKIEKLHQKFKSNLEALSKKHGDKLKGPYGLGAMVGMTVFGGDEPKTKAFTVKLFENGVLCFMASGHPTTRVRFLMPILAVTEADIDGVCSIIDETLAGME